MYGVGSPSGAAVTRPIGLPLDFARAAAASASVRLPVREGFASFRAWALPSGFDFDFCNKAAELVFAFVHGSRVKQSNKATALINATAVTAIPIARLNDPAGLEISVLRPRVGELEFIYSAALS